MKPDHPELMTKGELAYDQQLQEFAAKLKPVHIEQLYSLIKSRRPIEDGSVLSKSARDDLLEIGAISKAVFNGQEGYQVCTYMGAELFRKAMHKDGFEAATLDKAIAEYKARHTPPEDQPIYFTV